MSSGKHRKGSSATASSTLASRKDSGASAGSASEDIEDATADSLAQLDINEGDGDNVASQSTPKKKNKRRKKKRAGSIATESVEENPTAVGDDDEHNAESELPTEEDTTAAVAAASIPAEPASPSNEEDYMRTVSGKLIRMHREPWGRWSQTDYGAIKVRSLDYLTSGIKIMPPCPPTMEIKHLEIYICEKQIFNVCQYKDNWLQKLKATQAAESSSSSSAASPSPAPAPKKSPSVSASASSPSPSPSPSSPGSEPDLSSGAGLRPFDPDFWFVVTFHVQTNPTFHLTMYFQRRELGKVQPQQNGTKKGGKGGAASSSTTKRDDEEDHEPLAAAAAKKAFDTLFTRFVAGDTAYRNKRLKLIPFVVDGGNWFVTNTVGNRPCIIGNKITTSYYCDPKLNSMEVDIDVSGSRIGSGIFRVVKGYASYLTLDLTLLIEGQQSDELPEVILGGCRLRKVDLTKPEVRKPPRRE